MTREQLIAKFGNCSESFLKRNSVQPDPENRPTRLLAHNKKPTQRHTLERPAQGEEACWIGPCNRFGIRFVIYALRPADWDGWHIKELQDVLIEAGLLPDDSWKVIEEGSICTRKVHKAEDQRTEIIITPI